MNGLAADIWNEAQRAKAQELKRTITINWLRQGIEPSVISGLVGMSLEEVQKIADELAKESSVSGGSGGISVRVRRVA